MGEFVKGDIVTIFFPFSDLSGSKKRPAFVVTSLSGDDIILCQITSKYKSNALALPLIADDFVSGSLPIDSFIRPDKLFTANKSLILSTAGHVSESKIDAVVKALISLISPTDWLTQLELYRMGFSNLAVNYLMTKAKAVNKSPVQIIDELVSKELAAAV